jgi:hypothetical protein
MGVDRVIFGWDWPNIEGMPGPLDYLKDLEQFDNLETQLIMRDNARKLNTPQPLQNGMERAGHPALTQSAVHP